MRYSLGMEPRRRGRPPGPSRKIDVTCPECGRKFDTAVGYGNHMRKTHDLVVPEKTCWGCETVKPIEEFPRVGMDLKKRPKYGGKCTPCKQRVERERRAAKEARPTVNRRAEKRYRAARYFGLTLEEYEDICAEYFEKQDGKCAICLLPLIDGEYGLDHCHDKGEPRGLLCRNCNLGLGYFKDSTTRLLSAAKYLEERKS